MPEEILHAHEAWREFFVVGGHTGAVLLGLVFVGMEIHLDRINPRHHNYLLAAGSALSFLFVLLISLAMLAQPRWPWLPAGALIGLSLLTFLGSSAPLFSALRMPVRPSGRGLLIAYVLPYVASFALLGGSVGLWLGSVDAIYIIALGLFILIATGALNAWIFLVRGRQSARE